MIIPVSGISVAHEHIYQHALIKTVIFLYPLIVWHHKAALGISAQMCNMSLGTVVPSLGRSL